MKRLLLALFVLATVALSQDGVKEVWWRIAAPYSFTMAQWEAENLPRKWLERLTRGGGPQDEAKLVQDYFAEVARLRELEDRLGRGADVGEEASALRARMAGEEGRVEAVLEGQVSRVLSDLGLGGRFLGLDVVFPPVDFRFADLPHLLVISPRDRIAFQDGVLLRPDLDLEEAERIETLADAVGVSSLVESIGGFGTYPTLLLRVSLEWNAQTAAHEWLHTYFFFRPLGRGYTASDEMRTMNESAADLAGREIGNLVLERYYGTKVDRQLPEPPREDAVADSSAFNFNREMRATRLRVEELLAEGKIEEAEAYMRERRDFLEANGYYVRRLNQAYFAFHGAYVEGPGSVSPIGGQLEELRRRSPDLAAFIKTVAGLSSYEELAALVE